MEEKNIKNFFSSLKDKISDSTGVSSVSEQLDRLNTNLDKFSKYSEHYKQEITKLNNNLDKIKREDIEYFKQSTQALKIILITIAVLLLIFIVILIIKV